MSLFMMPCFNFQSQLAQPLQLKRDCQVAIALIPFPLNTNRENSAEIDAYQNSGAQLDASHNSSGQLRQFRKIIKNGSEELQP